MTELVDATSAEAAERAASAPPPSGPTSRRRRSLVIIAVAVAALVGGVISAVVATSGSAVHGNPGYRALTLVSSAYTPTASVGSTDDYHCTLVDPKVTQDSYVVSSRFSPGSPEVHHAVLSLVPPSLAATARRENAASGGNGWTCFGAPALPDSSLVDFFRTPWLSVWAPGHGADTVPAGTGIALPAGSLVVMQVHYNLLVGDKPVRNSLVLDTVPMSSAVLPLHVDIALAPPDLPCPTGVTGQLCNRAASLADQGRRFGADQVGIVGFIEEACGHDPSNPPVGDTTSCDSWTVGESGYIVRAQAHMHLLGRSFSLVVNPGTPQAKTVLNVPDYNFDYQKAYNLQTPIPVKAGDKLQVTCTYDPRVAQRIPILRKAPSHFVTWGDGSSDEMCLGLVWTSASLPAAHSGG